MVATLALGVILTQAWGILGISIALLAGRAIQSVAYPLIVRSCLEKPKQNAGERLAAVRMGITTALLFVASSMTGRLMLAQRWYVWFGGVVMTLLFVAALTLLLGPTPSDRRVIIGRVRTMVAGLRRQT